MRSFLWKLEPGFWTYGRICLLGPSGPNIVSRSQTPKANKFFEVSWFYWICLMIPAKIRSCLWKLELWFWTYGCICLLGPSDPNVVSSPQTPRSINFLRFHDFTGFVLWFLRKWGLVCENWSQGSGLMAGYVFWAQVAQMYSPQNWKKPFKNLLFDAILDM